jgi:glycerol uptake facilitator-like aquaporin
MQDVLTGPKMPFVIGTALALMAHKGAKDVGLDSDWWLYWVPLLGGVIGGIAIETFRDPVKRNIILRFLGM